MGGCKGRKVRGSRAHEGRWRFMHVVAAVHAADSVGRALLGCCCSGEVRSGIERAVPNPTSPGWQQMTEKQPHLPPEPW